MSRLKAWLKQLFEYVTIVELAICAVVFGLLLAMALPAYVKIRDKNRQSRAANVVEAAANKAASEFYTGAEISINGFTFIELCHLPTGKRWLVAPTSGMPAIELPPK